MTEVKKSLPNQGFKGVVFLLPPLGSGFQNYESKQGFGQPNATRFLCREVKRRR
jgi:hypothetical protein